ncbi:MAG TPA: hypothetical protein VFL83_16790 [Anaeromyxobacter sp.]|nr:hypothetical protein [Anaeromyxobacter sp.]
MRQTALALAALALALPMTASARPETARSGPWSVELVDDSGTVLPTFDHRGRTYVLGTKGRRYAVRVRNGTGGRIEVVVSVDGRDAIDGRPSSFGKRGYVVDPWDQVTVDGFRLSDASVAAFRFGSVASSYAARMGDARDVGVIGVAVFTEAPRWTPPPRPYRPSYPSGSDEYRSDAGAESAEPAPAPGAASGGPPAAQAPEAREKAAPRGGARAEARPGLGTEFGEERESAVARVSFERARETPASVLTLRYDDRPGLLALGIDVDGGWARGDEAWRREHADPFRRDASYSVPPPGWRP